MKIFKIAPFVFICSIFLVACGSQSSKEDEAKAQEQAEFDKKSEELRAKAREVFSKLPPATEVAARIQATGADFNGELVMDPANADAYLAIEGRDGLQAAIGGIYVADMGYLSAYGQKDAAVATFQAAQKLAEKLGVGRAFDQAVATRFAEKIEQSEEAKQILDEAFASANQDLRTEKRELISAAAATGLFIEGLYLLTAVVSTYPKDMLPEDARNAILGPLVKAILEREATLDKLIEIDAALAPDNAAADFFLYDLNDLKASFSKLNIEEKLAASDPNLVLNDETLAEITEKVAAIRERIVVQ